MLDTILGYTTLFLKKVISFTDNLKGSILLL